MAERVKRPAKIQFWSDEKIKGMMFKVNKFFRKELQTELSWRLHNVWKWENGK